MLLVMNGTTVSLIFYSATARGFVPRGAMFGRLYTYSVRERLCLIKRSLTFFVLTKVFVVKF